MYRPRRRGNARPGHSRVGEAYTEGSIPADAYGLDEEIPTIVVPNLLVVSDAMSEDLAYEITKAMFENLDTLASVHPEAENISLDTATETGPVECTQELSGTTTSSKSRP